MGNHGPPGLTHASVLKALIADLLTCKGDRCFVPLGILESTVKGELAKYLTDGRSRSVRKALLGLSAYGIIDTTISPFKEPAYRLRMPNGDGPFFIFFLSLLSGIFRPIEIELGPREIESWRPDAKLVTDQSRLISSTVFDPVSYIEKLAFNWIRKDVNYKDFNNLVLEIFPQPERKKVIDELEKIVPGGFYMYMRYSDPRERMYFLLAAIGSAIDGLLIHEIPDARKRSLVGRSYLIERFLVWAQITLTIWMNARQGNERLTEPVYWTELPHISASNTPLMFVRRLLELREQYGLEIPIALRKELEPVQ